MVAQRTHLYSAFLKACVQKQKADMGLRCLCAQNVVFDYFADTCGRSYTWVHGSTRCRSAIVLKEPTGPSSTIQFTPTSVRLQAYAYKRVRYFTPTTTPISSYDSVLEADPNMVRLLLKNGADCDALSQTEAEGSEPGHVTAQHSTKHREFGRHR